MEASQSLGSKWHPFVQAFEEGIPKERLMLKKLQSETQKVPAPDETTC